MEGKWFYFTDSSATTYPLNQPPYGRMLTGWIDYDGHTYFCTSDGAYKAEAKKDGWFDFQGSWYYLKGGDLVTSAYETINGKVYYFDANGKMACNEIKFGNIFQANGARVQSGWYKFQKHWYYVKPATHRIAVDEELLLGTKYYRFGSDGIMITGTYRDPISNLVYTYDSSGARTGPLDYKNGWYLVGGDWYYYKDGQPYSGPSGNGGWVGSYYVDSTGKMLVNQEVEGYWVGKNGAYIRNGWIKAPTGLWYFAENGGKLIKSNWYTDTNGKQYYFGKDGAMYTGVSQVENSYYAFDSNGSLVAGLSAREGWQQAGTYGWVYVRNGVPIMDETATINGETYSFYNGYMQRNYMKPYENTYGFYVGNQQAYFAASGVKQAYTGWKMVDGAWYYFNGSNRAVVGWVDVKGQS